MNRFTFFDIEVPSGDNTVQFDGASVQAEGVQIRQTSGLHDWAKVGISAASYRGTSQFLIIWSVAADQIPPEYGASVLLGLRLAAQAEADDHRPLVGVQIVVKSGSYHSVDSRESAYIKAAVRAYRQFLRTALPDWYSGNKPWSKSVSDLVWHAQTRPPN